MNSRADLDFNGLSSEVVRIVDNSFDSIVQLRRHLHMYPEPTGEEFETTKHLNNWLAKRGVSGRVVAAERGILCDLGDERLGKRFALRADTDALRIQDVKQVAYRSQVENVMHACGHDVHSAILAGSLIVLQQLLDSALLPPSLAVRGIFQPAEESCVGAQQMIEAGALDFVDAIFAIHVDPNREIQTVAFRTGVMNATCDMVKISIRGEGGHAARPHHTRDPITAAAQLINAVHVQVPRGTDSLDTVVIGFGSIHGGDQCNVIPDVVVIEGTLRALTETTRERTIKQLQEIAHGVGQASQTEIEISLGAGTLAVRNDATIAQPLQQLTRQLFGAQALELMEQPSMGGEDFAFYLRHVPGAIVRLGSRSSGAPITGLHTPNFDVDEEVIRVGVKLMVHIAVEWFARQFA